MTMKPRAKRDAPIRDLEDIARLSRRIFQTLDRLPAVDRGPVAEVLLEDPGPEVPARRVAGLCLLDPLTVIGDA